MNKCLNIALVSDYFYPNKGGVETHIKIIAEEFVKMGHSVIVITHRYPGFVGKTQVGSLTVYYLDIPVICMNTTYPTVFSNLFLFKSIFDRHKIEIVHGHQSLSSLCMEALFHATNLGLKTVLTDHSLFEVAKFERILVNNLNSFVCRHIDRIICVSNLSKENTSFRTGFNKEKIFTIPNGIVQERFFPLSSIEKAKQRLDLEYKHTQEMVSKYKDPNDDIVRRKQEKNHIFLDNKILLDSSSEKDMTLSEKKIRLIIMSRLSFRKGIDLFVDALPLICRNRKIEVLIVGDGPKRTEIEEVIIEHSLQDQVVLLGEVDYEEVGNILRTGDIFLNTSLTETFCLAIMEAASCGLLVVSTNVGAIKEVLGNDSILFCEPNSEDIVLRIEEATKRLRSHDPFNAYNQIKKRYTWDKVAKEIVKLYSGIPDERTDFRTRLMSFHGNENFLCRVALCIEFILISLFSTPLNKRT